MWKALHLLIAEQLKKPPMAKMPEKALHNQLNNVTNVRPTEKKVKGKKPTWELALFKEIAREQEVNWCVIAKHIDEDTEEECTKLIKVEDLWVENFSHIKPKGMNKDLRLDKSNIEIVSRAWHFKEHNGWTLRVKYKN